MFSNRVGRVQLQLLLDRRVNTEIVACYNKCYKSNECGRQLKSWAATAAPGLRSAVRLQHSSVKPVDFFHFRPQAVLQYKSPSISNTPLLGVTMWRLWIDASIQMSINLTNHTEIILRSYIDYSYLIFEYLYLSLYQYNVQSKVQFIYSVKLYKWV